MGAALACVLAVAAGAATAQDKDAVIKNRAALMKEQGKDLGSVKAFLEGKGDQAAAEAGAAGLVQTMKKIPDLFPPGTGGPDPTGDCADQARDLERLEQVPRGAQHRRRQGRRAPGRGQEGRQGGDPDRLRRSRQERLRRLPHRVPREAQKLSAAALALLLALMAPSAAGAAADDAVARGAYLAAAAGCDQCHTDAKNGGQPYAGGRALETPYGTIATPNITPDPETGIGRWSLADFTRAVRWGIAPDDTHYLPAFPYPFYNRLSDRDLADLKAFLDSRPAVRRRNAASSPAILASARGAVDAAASPFPGPWRPDPARDAAWNRGAYLVAAVGRCGDCHTPRNLLGAPDPGRTLAGTAAALGRKAAPNITPDAKTGIGDWSEADIVTLLKEGQTPDIDFVGGAMAEIVRNTARLDDADRRAIAVYLKSLPPIASKPKRK